jgi:Phosphotransferase enzyme family
MDDIRIDEGPVRSLLREQHPDLAGLEIREVAGGWDGLPANQQTALPSAVPTRPTVSRTSSRRHRKAPADAPANPTRGGPLARLRHDLDGWIQYGSSDFAADARHPANVIVSDGTLSGVIDFGELCAGDPATDLAAA